MSSRPEISIIIPCYNEQATIRNLLEAIRRQEYPLSRIEVVIADGQSTDGTRETVEAYRREHSDLTIRLVDNPTRSIPAALNRAVQLSHGNTVIRLDAHSLPYPDYVERCLEVLRETGAANVGGAWEIRPVGPGWLARGIAAAAAHFLGAGDARYRTGGSAGEVDTVPFGAFPREWLERVGPFNESLLTNEDYEFNLRIRRAGGRVWFDPSIRSIYFARGSLHSLARQYTRYGYWKSQMVRLYPSSIRWRQIASPFFVLSVFVLLFGGVVWYWFWILLVGILLTYVVTLTLTGILQAVVSRDPALAIGVPLALLVIHWSWGAAFLWGMIRPRVSRRIADGQS